jgi:hypothetical protein
MSMPVENFLNPFTDRKKCGMILVRIFPQRKRKAFFERNFLLWRESE